MEIDCAASVEEEKNPSYLGYLQAIPEEEFPELRFN